MTAGRAWAALFLAIGALISSSSLGEEAATPANAFLEVQAPFAPVALRAGGRMQLVYELHVTNFRPAAVTLSRVEVRGDPGGGLLHAYDGAELRSALGRVGGSPDDSDPRALGGGQRVVLFCWFPLEGDRVPMALGHTISFRVTGREPGFVGIGPLPVRTMAPLVLGPPLKGGPWVAVYDPGLANGHRRVVLAIDGRARIPARFAIDWIKLGPEGLAVHGDATVASSSYGYGEDVIAVADARVADALDEFPEPTPHISLENEAGNSVVLDLGAGRLAFYEHLKPGSVRVKAGERVRKGQVIAALGASGSVSSGAHLHFHVADSSSAHAAEGLPFVVDGFERLGGFSSLAELGRPWVQAGEKPVRISGEMPVMLSVVRFDGSK